MSSSRAKILIAGVWVLSFVICFPPLVGLKDSTLGNGTNDDTGFRLPRTHPMIINQRSFVTTSHDDPTTTVYTTFTTTTYSTLSLNLTDNIINNSSLESDYSGGGGDVDNYKIIYDDYDRGGTNNEYDDDMSEKKIRKRIKKSLSGDTLPKKMSAFSGVPVITSNNFHYPNHHHHSFQEVHNFDTSDDVLSMTTTTPTTTTQPTAESFQCPWICELTSDTGYVIYSALGSFFIPMGVMLFFYWKIYRAAVQTTRAINQGFRTTKGKEKILKK